MGGYCQLTDTPSNRAQIDVPGLVVDLVAETGGVDDGQGDAGSFLVKFKLCRTDNSQYRGNSAWEGLLIAKQIAKHIPTVMGLILTPSSVCAMLGSSDSLWDSTDLPQRVLTKVVRPGKNRGR